METHSVKKETHKEVTCDAMWDGVLNTAPGKPRYCCVCEGHNCQDAITERIRAGLPPPPLDAWCRNFGMIDTEHLPPVSISP